MKSKCDKIKPNRQQAYRDKQDLLGVARLEIQVSLDTKKRFDELVKHVADDMQEPFDPRRRLAKARSLVFDEMTHDTIHYFDGLMLKIRQLEEKIALHSPTLSAEISTSSSDQLRHDVASLPDDPELLKAN